MKLKRKYRIDGEDWTCHELANDLPMIGKTNFNQRTIMLDLSNGRKEVTLLHEVIHIVDDNAKLDLTEQQVVRLSQGLLAFMRDNKVNFLEDIET